MAANAQNRHTDILSVGLIVCAVIARVLGQYDILPMPFGLAHTVICIAICVSWGISANHRIVQSTVRRYMLGVSAMSVFWFVTRSIKYYFTIDTDLSRQLWYSYYVPILFIPLFVVFVALSLGKSEDYRPSKQVWLWIIPAVLSLIVLTNDFHQLVFTFPEGQVWSDDDYGHAALYYLIWASELAYTLAAFAIMLVKCRSAKGKQYLPAVLLFLANLYSIAYITVGSRGIIKLLVGDVVMVLGLLIIGILESAIRCGWIQTNTGYTELFGAGTIGAQITDKDYQTRYISSNARKLTEEAMRDAQNGAVELDKNTVLKGHPIAGGYVFWQEDITDLTAVLEKMEENRAAIARNNYIEEDSLRVKQELLALREKNHLYDLLQAKIAPQINIINRLFAQYSNETDEAERRLTLGKIAVVGAYIKRCGNLLFIGERSEYTDTAELSLCLEESFANLSLMGIDCAMDIPYRHSIATKEAIFVYDRFEQITETAMDSLHSVWLKARILEETVIFHLEVECDASFTAHSSHAEVCREEDGIWSFDLRIAKAGEAS